MNITLIVMLHALMKGIFMPFNQIKQSQGADCQQVERSAKNNLTNYNPCI
jgi:hypothetical protein